MAGAPRYHTSYISKDEIRIDIDLHSACAIGESTNLQEEV